MLSMQQTETGVDHLVDRDPPQGRDPIRQVEVKVHQVIKFYLRAQGREAANKQVLFGITWDKGR